MLLPAPTSVKKVYVGGATDNGWAAMNANAKKAVLFETLHKDFASVNPDKTDGLKSWLPEGTSLALPEPAKRGAKGKKKAT